jgi:F-type H+-transporting ATPase subunit alpha
VYRQISLLLRRPVGREAFPGDVFYCHSKLLERSVSMNATFGAGSLTSLPIVETIQNDVSAYIPTNIISITDGQIFLDLSRHQEGLRPAVDPGISVSRIGSSVQCKSMKKCSGSLKLELAQYRELESFAKFSDDMDAVAKKRLEKGRLLVEILLQKKNRPLEMHKQVLMLYGASSGFLNDIKKDYYIDSMSSFEDLLVNFLERSKVFKPFFYAIETELNPDIVDLMFIIFKKYKLIKLKKDNN